MRSAARRNLASNYLAYGAAVLSGLVLTPVIIGAISLSKKPANSRNTTLAILAVLLGIGGISGHFWYFATCQFCQ